jgi:type VI secretion system secreted protein Hcp
MDSHYYLQLDGIPGDCQETNHQRWIEVDNFNYGSPSGGIKFYEGQTDSSVTSLMKACVNGTKISSAALEAIGDGRAYMRMDLSACSIASCQIGAARGDNPPPVSFTVSYKSVKFTYYVKKDDAPSLPPSWTL